jgi:hypothetical protein
MQAEWCCFTSSFFIICCNFPGSNGISGSKRAANAMDVLSLLVVVLDAMYECDASKKHTSFSNSLMSVASMASGCCGLVTRLVGKCGGASSVLPLKLVGKKMKQNMWHRNEYFPKRDSSLFAKKKHCHMFLSIRTPRINSKDCSTGISLM